MAEQQIWDSTSLFQNYQEQLKTQRDFFRSLYHRDISFFDPIESDLSDAEEYQLSSPLRDKAVEIEKYDVEDKIR